MNLVRYLNNRLQEIAVDVNKVGGSLRLGAEADAVQFLFNVLRVLFAAVSIPKVLADFVLVNLRLKRVPAPALDVLRAESEQAKADRHRKLGRKVGVNGSH